MRGLLIVACAFAMLARPGSASAPAPAPIPVTNGYPYAASCPRLGAKDVVDRWRMYVCNCTSYVAWALTANGQRTDWFDPGEMDALNWAVVARAHGIPTGKRPRIGAVALWPHVAPPYGHVAFVSAVDFSGAFAVAEYNFPTPDGSNTYVFDRRSGLRPSGAIFIYVPRDVR